MDLLSAEAYRPLYNFAKFDFMENEKCKFIFSSKI